MAVSNEEKYPQTETMHYDIYVDKSNRYNDGLENSPNRFVKFSDRKISSCWGVGVMEGLYKGQYKGTWRGLKLLKHATVLQIYQELLQKEKPKTIIEFGTFHGGSALWLSDMCKLFSLTDTKILTVDISHQYLAPNTKEMAGENTEFILGDVTNIISSISPERLQSLPHPWFVMDDSHIKVDKVLLDMSPFMKSGDYYVVEDCHPDMVLNPDIIINNMPYETRGLDGDWPVYRELETAMRELDDDFQVDTYYCDYFGYNSTVNMNSYLRKM